MLKQVSHSKILIQPEGDPSYSIFFVIFFNFLKLGGFFFFLGLLDMGFFGRVGEDRASRHHISTFVTAETESLLCTLLMFFWGELLEEFDHINIHGVMVLCGPGGRGKRLESLGGPSTLLSNLLCTIPLILEVGGFRVPVINFIWDYVKGHHLLHEWSGNSISEEANEDIMVCDANMGGVTLECQYLTLERRGEFPVLLNHVVGG